MVFAKGNKGAPVIVTSSAFRPQASGHKPPVMNVPDLTNHSAVTRPKKTTSGRYEVEGSRTRCTYNELSPTSGTDVP